MQKYKLIIKDGIILVVVSTLFVTVCNKLFKGLKKTADSDSLVTAIIQNDDAGVKEVLSSSEFEKNPFGTSSLPEYLKARTARVDDQGRTPLMWAAYANVRDEKQFAELDAKHSGITQALIESGADLNTLDNDGWTALMWGSWSGLTGVVTKIVAAGADISITDTKGNTALTLAAQRGNYEIVKLLVNKGANALSNNGTQKSAVEFAETGLKQNPDKEKAYREVLTALGSTNPTL